MLQLRSIEDGIRVLLIKVSCFAMFVAFVSRGKVVECVRNVEYGRRIPKAGGETMMSTRKEGRSLGLLDGRKGLGIGESLPSLPFIPPRRCVVASI